MENIAKYGHEFKPPNHESRTWILKESVEDVENTIEAYNKNWGKKTAAVLCPMVGRMGRVGL